MPREGLPDALDEDGDSARSDSVRLLGSARKASQNGEISRRLQQEQFFAYVKTRHFWIVLGVGQLLALCTTSNNTFSSLLASAGASIPTFQILFAYIVLTLIYTPITMFKYHSRGWLKLVRGDGWRYFVLALLDVQGNYFTVLAYRYTNILSAQLISFWAVVVIVIASSTFLGVRYRMTQYLGILISIAGMGVLLYSDRITGASDSDAPEILKGDLFALLGATFYGISNCFEEFLVSKRPLYEVVGQHSLWGALICALQAAILERESFARVIASPRVGLYLASFTVSLSLFSQLVPIMLRLASAAFFNISLLTSNFWGVVVGIWLFHLSVHWMYPIAFALILVGLFTYFVSLEALGEAKKPWLGERQELGVSGIGTARRTLENSQRVDDLDS